MSNPPIFTYDWKRRLRPLMGAPIFVWLLLRPAYWPFATFGDSDRAYFLGMLNQLVWWTIVVYASAVVDYGVAWAIHRRSARHDDRDRFALPHLFYSALVATLVTKTAIDFTFASRPFPTGSQQLFASERYGDLVALALLPLIIWIAHRVGPPSQWRFVQAIRLDPPRPDATAAAAIPRHREDPHAH